MTGHVVHVPLTCRGFTAICSCGWRDHTVRPTKAEARIMASRHLREMKGRER